MRISREERIAITYQIEDILERSCRICPYNAVDGKARDYEHCDPCEHYKSLRELGNKLDPDRENRKEFGKDAPIQKVKMTVEEYRMYSAQYKDKEIAALIGVKPHHLTRWKTKHGLAPKRERRVKVQHD